MKVVERFHFVFGALGFGVAAPGLDTAATPGLTLSPFHQSRTPSDIRPQNPASAASARATSGRSAKVLPSSVTLSVPTGWPFVYGAIRRPGTSMLALRSL